MELPEAHVGSAVDLLGQRKGTMQDLSNSTGGLTRLTYRIPTRGLLGLRNALLTATRGTGMLTTIFKEYAPYCGELNSRENGSLTASAQGQVTSYALDSAQNRGRMMVTPGDEVYENQVVGIHQRAGDLGINVCKRKQATNVRSATKDQTTVLQEAFKPSLDEALEYIGDDELVEVTPSSVRIRKNPNFKSRR